MHIGILPFASYSIYQSVHRTRGDSSRRGNTDKPRLQSQSQSDHDFYGGTPVENRLRIKGKQGRDEKR